VAAESAAPSVEGRFQRAGCRCIDALGGEESCQVDRPERPGAKGIPSFPAGRRASETVTTLQANPVTAGLTKASAAAWLLSPFAGGRTGRASYPKRTMQGFVREPQRDSSRPNLCIKSALVILRSAIQHFGGGVFEKDSKVIVAGGSKNKGDERKAPILFLRFADLRAWLRYLLKAIPEVESKV